jgi:hypothetical protein
VAAWAVSWDIVIQDLPADARAVEDIPDDFRPSPLGLRTDLIRAVLPVAPLADFSDPSWGVLEGDAFPVEISMGHDEIVESIGLHVRGGDPAAGVVGNVIAHLRRRAVDGSTGDFFDPAAARDSPGAPRAFRDQVIGGSGRGDLET